MERRWCSWRSAGGGARGWATLSSRSTLSSGAGSSGPRGCSSTCAVCMRARAASTSWPFATAPAGHRSITASTHFEPTDPASPKFGNLGLVPAHASLESALVRRPASTVSFVGTMHRRRLLRSLRHIAEDLAQSRTLSAARLVPPLCDTVLAGRSIRAQAAETHLGAPRFLDSPGGGCYSRARQGKE